MIKEMADFIHRSGNTVRELGFDEIKKATAAEYMEAYVPRRPFQSKRITQIKPRPVLIRAHAAFHLDRDFSEALRQLSGFLDSIGIAAL